MENNCNYSDNWQPYINDYDKFEYDVKLKDGTIVENCYPNGGKFNSISDLHDGQSFDESEVLEIRFSQNPRFHINDEVSNATPDIEYEKRVVEAQYNEELSRQKKKKVFNAIAMASTMAGANIYEPYLDFMPKYKIQRGVRVDVRTEPKIGRNEICPKCESGLKYKRCCGVGK